MTSETEIKGKDILVCRLFAYLDKDETISWKIEVDRRQTFEDLHNFLKNFLKLPGNELASFYTADDNWRSIQEITLVDMSGGMGDFTLPTMKESVIDLFVFKPYRKLIYIYDFINYYKFFIEILEEKEAELGIQYPRCIEGKPRLTKTQLNRISKYAISNVKEDIEAVASQLPPPDVLDEDIESDIDEESIEDDELY